MKCLVLMILVLSIDISRCKVTNEYTKNTVPKETIIKNNTKQPNAITIPIMIHLDEVLTHNLSGESEHNTMDKFKLLAYDILRDVEKLFSRPTLQLKIKLELLGLQLLKNSTNSFAISENVSQYLKSYCIWQGEKKEMTQKWYYSVLFTGLDVFYLNNHGREVRRSTGRGYMKGMCSKNNSCTLLEWRSKNIAYFLAHEIAHSLGVAHDGPPFNECGGKRYIMNAKLNPLNPAKIWSSCNKIDLDQFLKSEYAWCLRQNVDNLSVHP